MKIKSLILASVFATTASSQSAITLIYEETGGNTVVTLEAVGFTTAGLAETVSVNGGSTYISPASGSVIYTGATDSNNAVDRYFTIPTFTFGTGGLDTGATDLGASNPFIAIFGSAGRLYVDDAEGLPANFTATATYSGNFAAKGIDETFQTFTFANGQVFNIGSPATIAAAVPEPSSTALLGLAGLSLALRRRR